ncbi:MAG: NAD-dependent protein deacylase [SAR202 cluster bacterium]|nr:NAD-dependent protein deacylase [Chloroflexota bacterium]MQG88818.1 NAD-dependent protein deacylase [SAR202 cluster bacterium]|tara:strand:+ start:516 stop:1319 length:804 start_codon:yes stop_codon:yes gene_type:complete
MTNSKITDVFTDDIQTQIETIAEVVTASKYVVGMTGAGMSVESGIPPFRGAGGLWTKYGTPRMDDYSRFKKDPSGWWKRRINEEIDEHIIELRDALVNAKPHQGHHALAHLEAMGCVHSVITQNIDALDEKAGITNLIEIHGNRTKLRCIDCGNRVALGNFVPLYTPEPCVECKGIVKFDTVMFGEPIPDDVMKNARSEINKADCILAIGTSATVRPASGLIWIAKSNGAKIIEINPVKTKLTPICEVSLRSTAGEALPLLAKSLSK